MHLSQLVARNGKMKVKDLSELNIKRTFDIFSFKSCSLPGKGGVSGTDAPKMQALPKLG